MANYRLPSRFLGTSKEKVAEFHFRTNDDQLDGVDFDLAARIGVYLKAKANRGEKIALYFVGNCDHTGKTQYNQRLALRRAKAVRKAVINTAGSLTQILTTSTLDSSFIVARSLGEERANQRARTRDELAVDRRVDVWHEIPRIINISVPQSLIDRRQKVVDKVADMESLTYDAEQHAVQEGSTRYRANDFSKSVKESKRTTVGSQSTHPISRRNDARIKLKVIAELEKVAEERRQTLNELKAKLRTIDRQIESYTEIR